MFHEALDPLLTVFLFTFVPWIELRGSIPLGIALGLSPVESFAVATFANLLIMFPAYYGLDLLYHRFFQRFAWCRKLVNGVHKKTKALVEKYGVLGLAIFVAVPLPGTGAYAGTAAGWLFGMKKRWIFTSVGAGVVAAGLIVAILTAGITKFF